MRQRVMTNYALLSSQNNDTLEVEVCREVHQKPHESIQSSGETTTDPQNPLVDAMETYGEEDPLLATGALAYKNDCNRCLCFFVSLIVDHKTDVNAVCKRARRKNA